MLCVMRIDVVLSVWFSVWIRFVVMLSEIGLRFVNGLLYMMSCGLSVIVCVSVMWCVILFDILDGIRLCVLCSLIVLSFISMRLWIRFLGRLVCLCSVNVMFLNIDMLVNNVLNWNSMFILWCNVYSLLCVCVLILVLLNSIWLWCVCMRLLIRCSMVVLL